MLRRPRGRQPRRTSTRPHLGHRQEHSRITLLCALGPSTSAKPSAFSSASSISSEALQRAAAAEASASAAEAAERLERDGVLAFLSDKRHGLKIDPPLSLFG